jgi:hypothetical protein
VSEWQNGWYVHHIYQDGLTNRGSVIGHWGATRRVPLDGVGARSHLLALQHTLRSGGSLDLWLRSMRNQNHTGFDYSHATEVGGRYSAPVGRALLGGELLLGRDEFGSKFVRLAAFTRAADAGFGAAVADLIDSATRATDASIFIDAGMTVSRVRVDRDKQAATAFTTAARGAPHLGLGLRRPVSDRSDLGARIELDQADGHALLAVRALDYRYRLSRTLALTAFAGAARYHLATPAYGYYVGGGLQWREVRPRWDLNFDLRYGDKLARDKLLPGESLVTSSDSFYDVAGAALFLSRHF